MGMIGPDLDQRWLLNFCFLLQILLKRLQFFLLQ